MAVFKFDKSFELGTVREVDTRKVTILVENDDDLRKARVGQLVAVELSGASETWLIAMIEKVIRFVGQQDSASNNSDEKANEEQEFVVNTVKLILVGTISWDAIDEKSIFTRSITQVPGITDMCYVLLGKQLETFMSVLSESGKGTYSLEFGTYIIDETAKAYLDGNKFFQRRINLGDTKFIVKVIECSNNCFRFYMFNIATNNKMQDFIDQSHSIEIRGLQIAGS